jgi:ribonuclease Z
VAAEKFHLTTFQAGELARRAEVKQVVPFHFSPRYACKEERLRREVQEAFAGR